MVQNKILISWMDGQFLHPSLSMNLSGYIYSPIPQVLTGTWQGLRCVISVLFFKLLSWFYVGL